MKRTVGMFVIGILMGFSAMAQDTFTDEELTKYATVMKWAEDEKAKMGAEVSEAVKANEALSGTAFNKLRKAQKAGDVNSTDATAEEVAAFMEIHNQTETRKAEFTEVYKEKIKSNIGAGLYNRLRKALKSDEEVKTRYQAILDGLSEESTDESED